MRDRKKRNANGLLFVLIILLLYLVLYIIDPIKSSKALNSSFSLLVNILPILLFVLIFMGILNYFLKPSFVKKHLGKGSGIKGWLLAISTGILSHGPVYVWYPLLKDMRDHGMRNGLVAAFLYNRSMKIPLLPVMIYYFGVPFVVILVVVMLIASILEGKMIDLLEGGSWGKS